MFKTLAFFLLILFLSSSSFSQYNQMIIGANNNGAIMSATIDGAYPVEMNVGAGYQSFYKGAYNETDGKVYLAWYYGIYSMDVDGSNFTQIFNYPSGGLGDGIAIDELNGHIYFTHTPVDSIYRIDLDGSNLTGIYGGPNVDYLCDIQLDVANNHIYFSEWILGQGVFRIDMNGTNEVTIIAGVDVRVLKTDTNNGHHYYVVDGDVFRCDLDGTNQIPIIAGQGVNGIALDLFNTSLFFSSGSNNNVFSTDLLGNNYSVLVQPTDILFNGTDPLDSPQGPILVNSPNPCGLDVGVTQNGATLTANATGVQYQWVDCDNGNAAIFGETNNSFTPNANGNYSVEVTEGTCIANSECYTISVVDLNNVYPSTFSIYPNPTTGILNWESKLNFDRVIVVDLIGRRLIEEEATDSKRIDLSSLPEGCYTILLQSEQAKFVRKIEVIR